MIRSFFQKLLKVEAGAVVYTGYISLCTMKTEKTHEIRAYIKGRVSLKVSASHIFNELCQIHGASAVSKRSVYRWHKKFKTGKTDLKDAPRPGQPKIAVTKANVAAVETLINQDARLTVKEIAHSLGISSGSVHKILTKELKLRKVCARWVPHLLTKEQKASRVKMAKTLLKKYKNCDKRRIIELITGDETWMYYFEPQRRVNNKQWLRKDQDRPVIAKRTKSAGKVLYAIFFNSEGPVVQIPVPKGRTVTGKFYKNNVLSEVKKHYEKRRPATGIRGLCLIHDNAAAHKCSLVQDFLEREKVVQLPHPPYSPDLSPCDFFLFPLLKKTLSGRRYDSRSALGSAIFQCLQGVPRKAYFSAFTDWISRLEKCISVNGEYFEGLK